MADTPLHWLEEPLPVYAEAAEWHEFAQGCRIPLAGCENIIGEADFSDAINAGHLSVLQPDVAKWGGITGCLSVARQALAGGRRYFPHFLGAGIGLAASAELLAGVGGDGLLEVDINSNPLRSMFFDENREPVTDGRWRCTDAPGLGIDALPNDIKKFQTLHVEIS